MYNTQEKAKQMADIHVLWGQSSVIEELIQAGKIDEEYLYPFNGEEVLEWWLVTSWLADRLREQGEIHHRRTGLPLVGTNVERSGHLHGSCHAGNLQGD